MTVTVVKLRAVRAQLAPPPPKSIPLGRTATIAMSQAEKLLTGANTGDALIAERAAVTALPFAPWFTVCGVRFDNARVDDAHSTLEALCVSPIGSRKCWATCWGWRASPSRRSTR